MLDKITNNIPKKDLQRHDEDEVQITIYENLLKDMLNHIIYQL